MDKIFTHILFYRANFTGTWIIMNTRTTFLKSNLAFTICFYRFLTKYNEFTFSNNITCQLLLLQYLTWPFHMTFWKLKTVLGGSRISITIFEHISPLCRIISLSIGLSLINCINACKELSSLLTFFSSKYICFYILNILSICMFVLTSAYMQWKWPIIKHKLSVK